MTRTTYAFDNSAVDAVDQLTSLEAYLDPVTKERIAQLHLPGGARCWEIGAGAGSIAAWLASDVAVGGSVLATDINTSRLGHLEALSNVNVAEHDVSSPKPPAPEATYDLIHARLVLLHLPARERILSALAARLAPGGWLVLEEFDCTRPLHVYTSRSDVDTELFVRVTNAVVDILIARGADMAWAQAVHPAMVRAGLVNVHTVTRSESWTGGTPGARLHAANSRQLAFELEAMGITGTELQRFRDVVGDPAHAAASYLLVSTRGGRAE